MTNCDRFVRSDLVPLVGSLHLFAFIVRASGPFLAPRFCEHARALFRTEMTSFRNVIAYTRCQRRNWSRWRRKLELSWVTISRNNWWTVSFDFSMEIHLAVCCRVNCSFLSNIEKRLFCCSDSKRKRIEVIFKFRFDVDRRVSHGVMLLVDRDTFGVGGRSVPTLRT